MWGGRGFENRELNVIRSGAIPRLFNLPAALAAVHGQQLRRDGTLISNEKQNVNILRTWFEDSRRLYPTGSIVIQSTSANSWPYPALLYKRGAWSAIDLLFFLPGIPMTTMNEMDGRGYRPNTFKFFQKQLKSSVENIEERVEKFEPYQENLQAGSLLISSSISEKSNRDEIFRLNEQLRIDIGPQFGFDTRKIHLHYEHRRVLRHNKDVLKYGSMVQLLAEHSEGLHSHVLSFARVLKKEIAIIATNFNDFNVYFSINMKNLKYLFEEINSDLLETAVVKIQDILGSAFDDYYTTYEFLNGRIDTSLKVILNFSHMLN